VRVQAIGCSTARLEVNNAKIKSAAAQAYYVTAAIRTCLVFSVHDRSETTDKEFNFILIQIPKIAIHQVRINFATLKQL
jgi:hypothetical protein